jgi:hypothetical protein
MAKALGYTIKKTGKGQFTFKSRGGFDLRLAPELQAMGMRPHKLDKGEPCKCGKPVPWHLFELGALTHRCACGRGWQSTHESKDSDVREVV